MSHGPIDEKKHRLCGHAWTTNNGKLGSNHGCGLEHGHAGTVHECGSCHETVNTEPESEAVAS